MKERNKKEFSRTEFVTVNVVRDWINSIRDMLGLEQKTYAKVVNEKVEKMFEEINSEGKILWFRQKIDDATGNAIRITIYGQQEVE